MSECYLMLEATPDGFVPVADETIDGVLRCVPEAVSRQSGDYGTGARCPSAVPDPPPSECAA